MRLLFTIYAMLSIALTSCGGGGNDNNSSNATGFDSFPVHASPQGFPPFSCTGLFAPGAGTVEVMQKLNAFWESNVAACACDSLALSAGCQGGGLVNTVGYIFYDRDALNNLDFVTKSRLPADMVLAHEFGHNIQLALGLNPPGKFKELQADCLAGYYVGYQAKKGLVTVADVNRTFAVACQYGDPLGIPWWIPGSHGTCSERANSVQQGISGYSARLLPGQACP